MIGAEDDEVVETNANDLGHVTSAKILEWDIDVFPRCFVFFARCGFVDWNEGAAWCVEPKDFEEWLFFAEDVVTWSC